MPESPTLGSQKISIRINGSKVFVSPGTSVAAAIMTSGAACRISAHGTQRGPLCGMGICQECRATINGVRHQVTCQLLCATGMEITTNA